MNKKNLFKRNQSMGFQSWKFGSLNGRKQLHTAGVHGILFLVMAVEIAIKEIIFDLLPTIDRRYQTASQCLSHNFPASIPTQIKTTFERIMMAPRFIADSCLYYKSIR